MLLSPPPKMQFLGDDGLPLTSGKVYTYAKGTTTPLVTYSDLGGITPNTNPVILDSYGRAAICFQQLSYTLVVHSSADVLQGCSGDVEFPASVGGGESVEAYSDIVSYSFPDVVAGSDGYTYRCVGVNILGDDPVGSVTGNWVNLSPAGLNSPAFTGIPTAPTAAHGTNTTQIATTAFVQQVKGIKNEITGGDITISGNTLTIKPCACWDSTRLIWLETTENKTLVLPSTTANQVYHVFEVRLVADSSINFRAYTTVAGPASDAEINAYRRIDYWFTNDSNAGRAGITVNGVKWWSRFSENDLFALTTPPANITTSVDLSNFIPDDFYSEVLFGAQGNSVLWPIAYISGVSGAIQAQVTGSNLNISAGQEYEWEYLEAHASNRFIPIVSNEVFWGRGTGSDGGQTVSLAIHAVKLRR